MNGKPKTLAMLAAVSLCAYGVLLRRSAADPQAVFYTYDGADRLVNVRYDKDGVIHYEYDESGNRTRKTVIGPGNPTADYDGNTLADLWEYIYFGFTGLDPSADSDGDGFTEGQEAQCWTDPTNALSHLRMTGLEAQFDASNEWVVIKWPSQQYATYALGKATNLVATNVFWLLTNNIPATPPLNTYTDRVDGILPLFYRIKVGP